MATTLTRQRGERRGARASLKALLAPDSYEERRGHQEPHEGKGGFGAPAPVVAGADLHCSIARPKMVVVKSLVAGDVVLRVHVHLRRD